MNYLKNKKYLLILITIALIHILLLNHIFNPIKINSSINLIKNEYLFQKENYISNNYDSKLNIKILFSPSKNLEKKLTKLTKKQKKPKCIFYQISENELKNYTLPFTNKVYKSQHPHFKGILHDKFCILNDNVIWTGSLNPTSQGFYKNNNNVLIINSKKISENYLNEYNNIRSNKNKKTPYPIIFNNDTIIENYFCPRDNCTKQILKILNKAKKNIYFMSFSFTDEEISNNLIKLSQNIYIEGIMEKKRINLPYNKYKQMSPFIKIYLDHNPYTMHNKIFIIDENTTITGSFNPTHSANNINFENILIIHNKKISKIFLKEYFLLTKE